MAVFAVVLVLAAAGLSRAGPTPEGPGLASAPPTAGVGSGASPGLEAGASPGLEAGASPGLEAGASPGLGAGGAGRTPAAGASAMDGSPPLRVSIPRLRVDSELVALTLLGDGAMEVPDDASTVGWFTGGPTPGSIGPAVLAGHVNWKGRDGAFARLGTLVAGDEVQVERLDGSVAVFAVTGSGRYPKDRFPTDAVYGPVDHAGLRLITCGGEFDRATGHYRDNIVVWAVLRP
ncbi:hypothetical protein GCM10010532_104190 [Dactylosporangium siamense]|uniref:Class F sortase n=1 Tax=Dactylosporangium siamense TaxID=685454 RepID=A0A919PZH1_9ACTN|nr:hypothetical protein Dsi01nite_095890 [Dactylosporangium siamense]